jgi:hypothetical protein
MVDERKDDIYTTSTSKTPNFEQFVVAWSQYCEENNSIFYKTPEHLKVRFKVREDRQKNYESVKMNSEMIESVRSMAQSSTRFVGSIPALPKPSPPVSELNCTSSAFVLRSQAHHSNLSKLAAAPSSTMPNISVAPPITISSILPPPSYMRTIPVYPMTVLTTFSNWLSD